MSTTEWVFLRALCCYKSTESVTFSITSQAYKSIVCRGSGIPPRLRTPGSLSSSLGLGMRQGSPMLSPWVYCWGKLCSNTIWKKNGSTWAYFREIIYTVAHPHRESPEQVRSGASNYTDEFERYGISPEGDVVTPEPARHHGGVDVTGMHDPTMPAEHFHPDHMLEEQRRRSKDNDFKMKVNAVLNVPSEADK